MNSPFRRSSPGAPPAWFWTVAILGVFALVGSLWLVAGCATAHQRGDEAAARGNWEAAIAAYEEALASESDTDRLKTIRAGLEEAKLNASQELMLDAKHKLAIGDTAGALVDATRAAEFHPTDEVLELLGRLRTAEGDRLRAVGQSQLDSDQGREAFDTLTRACELRPGDADCLGALRKAETLYGEQALVEGRAQIAAGKHRAAISSLEVAQKYAPTEQGAEALADARAEFRRKKAAAMDNLSATADAAIEAHNWDQAADALEKTMVLEPGCCKDKLEFTQLMSKAEQHERADLYRAALRFGIESDYVRLRLQAVEPARYEITVTEAAILPTKADGSEWDVDVGSLTRPVADATGLLAAAAKFDPTGAATLASVVSAAAEAAGPGLAKPDPRLEVVYQGRRSVLGEQDDTLSPIWSRSVLIGPASIHTPGGLQFIIVDVDVASHDPIGQWNPTIQDLVRRGPGQHVIRNYLDPGGSVPALLGLRVTITRR